MICYDKNAVIVIWLREGTNEIYGNFQKPICEDGEKE